MKDKIILYEHGCPMCIVLKAKLDKKGIQYEDITDVDVMIAKGFTEAPKLEVNGNVMGFGDAIKWIEER